MAGGRLVKQSKSFLENLLNALLPNRAAPVLAKVIKSHEGPGKTKYSVDVVVLKAGSLEETDQTISEVPISPIWATTKKRGVYAIPNEGQVVIVEFLEWNLAYPYVSGIYSDEYETDEFYKNKFMITDGDGMWIIVDSPEKSILIDTGKDSNIKLEPKKITAKTDKSTLMLREDKFSEKNQSESLFPILKDFMQLVHDKITVGWPGMHKTSPKDKLALTKLIQRLTALMEA
jgi:hypothetical protein